VDAADRRETMMHIYILHSLLELKELRGLSPRANYTDRATAATQLILKENTQMN
jgi:hypothetical protein